MRKILIVLFVCTVFLYHQTTAQQKTEQWGRFELALKYNCPGNAFTDVQLSAKFSNKDTSLVVLRFYDGDNTFKIKFMPTITGTWTYKTSSNIKALNKNSGSFECVKASGINHGMVKVSDTYHYKYADGKRYFPFGTTAYAWIHMGKDLQETTFKTLEKTGFNKVRMCVFPKNYNLVQEEPEIYPFVIREAKKGADGKEVKAWDMTIKTDPQVFETGAENDYRLYDKDLKKLRLPLKPYLALIITEITK